MDIATVNIQELVDYVAKSLVEDPSQVHVTMHETAHSIILELHVGPDDMGRVIGRGGKVINALRTLVRIAAMRQGKRVTLELV